MSYMTGECSRCGVDLSSEFHFFCKVEDPHAPPTETRRQRPFRPGKSSPPGFSYWQLFSLYKNCPWSYKLAFIDRAPPSIMRRPKVIYNTFKGSLFHDLMEQKYKIGWDWHLTEMMSDSVANSLIETEVGVNVTIGQKCMASAEVKRAIVFMRTGPLRQFFDSVTTSEMNVFSNIGADIIKGRIDAYGEILQPMKILGAWLQPGDDFIIDWKLQSSYAGGASRQLAFYHVVKPVTRAYIFYPSLLELKPVRLSESRALLLKQDVIAMIEGIKAEHFPKVYARCKWCYYSDQCRRRSRRKT